MNPTAVARPLPGSGLVARNGDLLMVCADGADGVEELLDLVSEVAAAGGDGTVLIRRVAALLAADFDDRFPACAATGPAPDGRLAVLVYRDATAEIVGADGQVSLSGAEAFTSVNRLVAGPISAIKLMLPGAGSASPRARLDGGIVVAGGVDWSDHIGEAAGAAAAGPGSGSVGGGLGAALAASAGSMMDSAPVYDPPAPAATPPAYEPPAYEPPAYEPAAYEPPAPTPPAYDAYSAPAEQYTPPATYTPPAQPDAYQAPPPVEAYAPPPAEAYAAPAPDAYAAAQPYAPAEPPYLPPPPDAYAPPAPEAYAPAQPAGYIPLQPDAYPQPDAYAQPQPGAYPQPDAYAPPAEAYAAPPAEAYAAPPADAYAAPPAPPAYYPPPEAPPPVPDAAAPAPSAPAEGGPRVLRTPDPAAPFVAVLLVGDHVEADEPPAPLVDMRPRVLGVLCQNDHFNDPNVHYCSVCGISMAQQTLVKHEGPRPPLGVLLMDDGMTFRLDTDYVIGREPQHDPEVVAGAVRPLRVADAEGVVSRRHARVALVGWDVQVVDLGSANGTYVQLPGDPQRHQLAPNQPVVVQPGTLVTLGRRWFRYESHRNP